MIDFFNNKSKPAIGALKAADKPAAAPLAIKTRFSMRSAFKDWATPFLPWHPTEYLVLHAQA